MKIKIGLLSLFFANSIIYPIYADKYATQLEADEVNINPIIEKNDEKVDEVQVEEAKSKDLIKLGATITMGPSIVYQEKRWSSQNRIGADLTFKAEVPNAWCNQAATFKITAACQQEKLRLLVLLLPLGK